MLLLDAVLLIFSPISYFYLYDEYEGDSILLHRWVLLWLPILFLLPSSRQEAIIRASTEQGWPAIAFTGIPTYFKYQAGRPCCFVKGLIFFCSAHLGERFDTGTADMSIIPLPFLDAC